LPPQKRGTIAEIKAATDAYERIESTTSHAPAKNHPTTKYAVKSVNRLMRHQPFYSRTVGHETKAI
jgi:hypothetical protein